MEPQKVRGMDKGKLRIIFRDSGYKIGAEIGVFEGRHAEQLCKDIPGLKLYCIDAWEWFEIPSSSVSDSWMHKVLKGYETTKARLAAYNAILIKKPSAEAAKDFENGSLDFVYIDANHEYDFIMQDLIAWVPKVRIGGIVSGHDYHRSLWGVRAAVNDYTRYHKIERVFYTGEGAPSFWWVR